MARSNNRKFDPGSPELPYRYITPQTNMTPVPSRHFNRHPLNIPNRREAMFLQEIKAPAQKSAPVSSTSGVPSSSSALDKVSEGELSSKFTPTPIPTVQDTNQTPHTSNPSLSKIFKHPTLVSSTDWAMEPEGFTFVGRKIPKSNKDSSPFKMQKPNLPPGKVRSESKKKWNMAERRSTTRSSGLSLTTKKGVSPSLFLLHVFT